MMKKLIYSLLIMLGGLAAAAQSHSGDSVATNVPTIADRLVADGAAEIAQPQALNERLRRVVKTSAEAGGEKVSVGGYRILVFSGNNAVSAKNEADARAAAVNEHFPEYETYVSYSAPYWRLKVGDFREYEDAAAALSAFKKSFPNIAREMRLVRERINVKEE